VGHSLVTSLYSLCPALMVGPSGFEPPTLRLSGVRSNQLSYGPFHPGPPLPGPNVFPGGRAFSPAAQRATGPQGLCSSLETEQDAPCRRSNRPRFLPRRVQHVEPGVGYSLMLLLLRKEVIQPHLPIRLPCYDFIPLTGHTFGTSLPTEWRGWVSDFGCTRLRSCDGRCVQGPGTYSPRRS
jgi:hypothetical protein